MVGGLIRIALGALMASILRTTAQGGTGSTPGTPFHYFKLLVKHFEGYYKNWYKCPAGYWTIGYGHVREDEDPVPWSISEHEASEMLREEYEKTYLPAAVNALEAQGIDVESMPAHHLGAIVSGVYNLGPQIVVDGSWVDFYKDKDMGTAGQRWYLWSKHKDPGTGKLIRSKGLVRRRFSEWYMLKTGTFEPNVRGYEAWYENHQ